MVDTFPASNKSDPTGTVHATATQYCIFFDTVCGRHGASANASSAAWQLAETQTPHLTIVATITAEQKLIKLVRAVDTLPHAHQSRRIEPCMDMTHTHIGAHTHRRTHTHGDADDGDGDATGGDADSAARAHTARVPIRRVIPQPPVRAHARARPMPPPLRGPPRPPYRDLFLFLDCAARQCTIVSRAARARERRL